MHVKAKKMATAGLLVAFTVVMMILSSVIETSSLFFIAAASFCVGIAIREWGIWFGVGFLVASVSLNLLLAPNKLYCFTFLGMGTYLLLSEALWEYIAEKETMSYRTLKLWIGKYIVFNLIYVPVLLFVPSLILVKEVDWKVEIILLLAGQVALLVYDVAYRYFQSSVWGRLRTRLMESERNY